MFQSIIRTKIDTNHIRIVLFRMLLVFILAIPIITVFANSMSFTGSLNQEDTVDALKSTRHFDSCTLNVTQTGNYTIALEGTADVNAVWLTLNTDPSNTRPYQALIFNHQDQTVRLDADTTYYLHPYAYSDIIMPLDYQVRITGVAEFDGMCDAALAISNNEP